MILIMMMIFSFPEVLTVTVKTPGSMTVQEFTLFYPWLCVCVFFYKYSLYNVLNKSMRRKDIAREYTVYWIQHLIVWDDKGGEQNIR